MEALRHALFGSAQGMLDSCLRGCGPSNSPTVHTGAGTLTLLAEGVLEWIPAQASAGSLVISTGIHGNETAPIEILDALINEVLSGTLVPARPALLIMGNPAAMRSQQRFVDANLNRLFTGVHARSEFTHTQEGLRARELEDIVAAHHAAHSICQHYDLHTAIRPSLIERFALYPFRDNQQPKPAELACLHAMGVSALVHQNAVATTFSSHTAQVCNAESFTVELGKVKPFGHNDLPRFNNVAKALRVSLTQTPFNTENADALQHFAVAHEIIHQGKDWQLFITDDAPNFTAYPQHTCIWQQGNKAYRVQHNEEHIIFPNAQVPQGQRAGLMLHRLADGDTMANARQAPQPSKK